MLFLGEKAEQETVPPDPIPEHAVHITGEVPRPFWDRSAGVDAHGCCNGAETSADEAISGAIGNGVIPGLPAIGEESQLARTGGKLKLRIAKEIETIYMDRRRAPILNGYLPDQERVLLRQSKGEGIEQAIGIRADTEN
jgi:hypothetical protein